MIFYTFNRTTLLIASALVLSGCCGAVCGSMMSELDDSLCRDGDAKACVSAAMAYTHGITKDGLDHKKNKTKAVELFASACALDDIHCHLLAPHVAQGQGGQNKDPKRALELYAKSCKAGQPNGVFAACAAALRIDALEGFKHYKQNAIDRLSLGACKGLQGDTLVACIDRVGLVHPNPPKALQEQPVLQPVYAFSDDSIYTAGKAFLASTSSCNATVMMTALHIFEGYKESGKTRPPFPTQRRVLGLSVGDAQTGETVFSTAPAPLYIRGARPMSSLGGVGDVAAFIMPKDLGLPTLRFAQRPLHLGEKVFVWTTISGAPERGVWHRATVVYNSADDPELGIVYEHPLSIQATSGAAVVNRFGEVIGVHLGGGGAVEGSDDSRVGVVANLTLFGPALEQAACPRRNN